jgi:hypothetical protein
VPGLVGVWTVEKKKKRERQLARVVYVKACMSRPGWEKELTGELMLSLSRPAETSEGEMERLGRRWCCSPYMLPFSGAAARGPLEVGRARLVRTRAHEVSEAGRSAWPRVNGGGSKIWASAVGA